MQKGADKDYKNKGEFIHNKLKEIESIDKLIKKLVDTQAE